MSPEKAEALSLRFDRQEDALHFAQQFVKDSQHWLAANDLDPIKRYRNVEIDIVIKVYVRSLSRNYDLVCSAIPGGANHRDLNSAVGRDSRSDHEGGGKHQNGNEHPVLVTDAYFIECPKQIIPSSVWLEGAKERTDLLREIFGPPIKRVFKLSGTPGEGEGAVFRDGLTGRDGDSVPGLIQRRPEIACDITNRLGER